METLQILSLIFNALTAVGALLAVWIAVSTLRESQKQSKMIIKQLKQTNEVNLTTLSIQQNWELYNHSPDLPRAAVPIWKDLNQKGWGWLVILLNRLNLFQLACEAKKKGLMSEEDFNGWVLKEYNLFQPLRQTDSSDEDINQGREILRQLLHREGGYPSDFRKLLLEEEIIGDDLISD